MSPMESPRLKLLAFLNVTDLCPIECLLDIFTDLLSWAAKG